MATITEMALRIPSTLKASCVNALSEAMDIPTMTHLASDIIRDYDIYERTGIRPSMAIPNRQVATQIIDDIARSNQFLKLVARLIRAQDAGIMGRRYQIPNLREIIKGTYDLGFLYDTANSMFVENSRYRKTRNWGVLDPGVEYMFAFLSLDIVGNTELVRTHPTAAVSGTYDDLRTILTTACEARNGRVWLWEGDGGIATFYFGDKHASAVLSAMDVIHSLFLYNKTRCRLNEPLRVRIAVHSGECEYTDNEEALKKTESVKELFELERQTPPRALGVSAVVKVMLDEFIVEPLKRVGTGKRGHWLYTLELEP